MTVREFPGLIDLYGDALYGFCVRLTGNRHDADDLWQDTFLRAFERTSRIDQGGNPKGYLFSICVSVWKTDRRRNARQNARNVSWDDAPDLDAEQNIEADTIQKEQARTVNRAVESLDESLRLPVYLHYTAGMGLEEIARVLKIPKGTVKSRLFRARGLIQQRLERDCFER